MKTAAQITNAAKVRLQQQVVKRLRDGGKDRSSNTWRDMTVDEKLWSELESYDLCAPERQSHLNKVAFPDGSVAEVDAALKEGNNLNKLYDLARGRAKLIKDSQGRYVRGKKGLRIVPERTGQ